jgi:ParB family chromosome partitioning protein
VREVEKQAKAPKTPSVPSSSVRAKDADTELLERDLKAALGMSVSIEHTPGQETGTLKIRYRNLEQLDEVCRRLSAVDGGKI